VGDTVKTVGGGGGGAETKMKMGIITIPGGAGTAVGAGRGGGNDSGGSGSDSGGTRACIYSGYGLTHLIKLAPLAHLGISASYRWPGGALAEPSSDWFLSGEEAKDVDGEVAEVDEDARPIRGDGRHIR
jgi:hypothetical protein